jgi:hypothetical protein
MLEHDQCSGFRNMIDQLGLSSSVELKPGEELRLPRELVEKVGPGRWTITITPWTSESGAPPPIRRHDAFLQSFAPEDEGLYDDLAG